MGRRSCWRNIAVTLTEGFERKRLFTTTTHGRPPEETVSRLVDYFLCYLQRGRNPEARTSPRCIRLVTIGPKIRPAACLPSSARIPGRREGRQGQYRAKPTPYR